MGQAQFTKSFSVLSNSSFELPTLNSELFLTLPATLGLTLNSEWVLNWPPISPSTAECTLHTAYINWGRGLDNFWLRPWIMICKLPRRPIFHLSFTRISRWLYWLVLKMNSRRSLFFSVQTIIVNSTKIHLSCLPEFHPLDHTRFH